MGSTTFEDIPEDREESYPCGYCGGDIIQVNSTWVCNLYGKIHGH